MPYFLLFLTYIIWRMFFIPLPEIGDRNTPVILYELFSNTLKTLLHLIEVIIQDLIHATVYSWSETINPSSFDFNRPAWIGSWVISFVAAAALYVLFSRIRKNDIQEEKDSSWVRSFLMVGFLATIFGALPGWLIGQQIYNPKSLWSDRFALPVLIGASILAIGLIEVFFQNKKFQTIIFCGLILLGVSNNIRLANEYRWSWTKQNRFYWQLLWRAPGLEPGTAIFAEGDIFNYMGHYPTSYAINFLYPPGEDPSVLNYWFFPLSRGLGGSFEEAKKGMEIFAEHRSSSFTGNSRDGIAIYYLPENGYCLWVLDPLDKMNPEIPDITKEIVEISNLERIKPTSFSSAYPPPGLLMEEPEHTWCYYYQKAELARQMQDWEQILTYWDITEANGFRTNNTIELVPFIEAFANSNEWTRAFEITMDAKTFTEKAYPFLCSIWANIERTTSSSEQSEDILNSIWEELNCN
ncbi:MAG: hypothetical protein MUO76_11235 [Anaerolineaceae bacterium]|nr:hypothetical protein [Anaerolineaceae bacterium]